MQRLILVVSGTRLTKIEIFTFAECCLDKRVLTRRIFLSELERESMCRGLETTILDRRIGLRLVEQFNSRELPAYPGITILRTQILETMSIYAKHTPKGDSLPCALPELLLTRDAQKARLRWVAWRDSFGSTGSRSRDTRRNSSVARVA
jgi:hypothetical protein